MNDPMTSEVKVGLETLLHDHDTMKIIMDPRRMAGPSNYIYVHGHVFKFSSKLLHQCGRKALVAINGWSGNMHAHILCVDSRRLVQSACYAMHHGRVFVEHTCTSGAQAYV